jgi:hypothetical protein
MLNHSKRFDTVGGRELHGALGGLPHHGHHAVRLNSGRVSILAASKIIRSGIKVPRLLAVGRFLRSKIKEPEWVTAALSDRHH